MASSDERAHGGVAIADSSGDRTDATVPAAPGVYTPGNSIDMMFRGKNALLENVA